MKRFAGEFILGEVMLPGQGEADQITKIFRAIGAPNEEKWPGFSTLPNAGKVTWKASSRGKLRCVSTSIISSY